MNPIKWAEIAVVNSKPHYECLSRFLTKNNCPNELSFIEVTPMNFNEALKEALNKYDLIRVGSPYGKQIINEFVQLPEEVRFLGCADTIWKNGKSWELMSGYLRGISRVILDVGDSIEKESSVLIVGSGAAALSSIAAFVKQGVKTVNITNKFVEEAKALLSQLRKRYFDVEFNFVPEEKLVMLPGTNIACVNTTPLVSSNDLLYELYYYNFLKSSGTVIDFTMVPVETPLIAQAKEIGLKTVYGYQVASHCDFEWVKKAIGFSLDRESYSEHLRNELSQIKFDLSGFVKDPN